MLQLPNCGKPCDQAIIANYNVMLQFRIDYSQKHRSRLHAANTATILAAHLKAATMSWNGSSKNRDNDINEHSLILNSELARQKADANYWPDVDFSLVSKTLRFEKKFTERPAETVDSLWCLTWFWSTCGFTCRMSSTILPNPNEAPLRQSVHKAQSTTHIAQSTSHSIHFLVLSIPRWNPVDNYTDLWTLTASRR